MTARSIALIFAAIISIGALATPDAAMAQPAQPKGCERLCDCKLDCLDFCSTNDCLRASRCKGRVELLQAQCQRTCNTCRRLHKK
jgi:hypothetical protein